MTLYKFRLIIFILSTFLFAQQLYAMKEINDQYPRFRRFRAGFNITFGAMSYFKAKAILEDKDSTSYEKDLANSLTAIGILRIGDGIFYLFRKSLPERLLDAGKLDPNSPDLIASLQEAASFERKLKFYRGGVIILNGIGFLSIYAADTKKNSLSLYPGLGMAFVSVYALFKKAPSEMALERIKKEQQLTTYRPVHDWGINYKQTSKSNFIPFPEYTYSF